jgi:hypothetical protein
MNKAKLGNKSISELEGWRWKSEIPTPETDSFVVNQFYKLHNKPVVELELAEIGFLIGQESGLEYLIPIAIEALKENPLLETEDFDGDLLWNMLSSTKYRSNYWKTHSKEKNELINLYNTAFPLNSTDVVLVGFSLENYEFIKEAYKEFLSRTS